MRTELLRFNGAVEGDPTIDAWMKVHAGELRATAHQWFELMRKCGDEVGNSCMTAARGMFGRCALQLRRSIHFARKRGVLSRRTVVGSLGADR
jgi:hypothetical protein